MTTLVKMTFGSRLYGTATEDSDTDIKGVFLPELRELLLGRAPRHQHTSTGDNQSRNTSEDVDVEMFSLHHFIDEACKGETFALDMLHAPPEMLIESSPTWMALRSHRARFYTKNLKAFVGYARRQAAKYGVKGSRLSSARKVLELMEQEFNRDPASRMAEIMDRLGELQLEHVHIEGEFVQACGKKLLWNARIGEYLVTMRKFVTNYGDRAQQAELNQGIDWKAISHAYRAAYEVESILTIRDIRFPLPQAPQLLEIKKGLVPFKQAAEGLEQLMERLETLAAESDLPEKVDRTWWDNWLVSTLQREYGLGPLWGPGKVAYVSEQRPEWMASG